MTLIDALRNCINNYATFDGRAPRSEYWWMVLFSTVFQIVVPLLFGLIGNWAGGAEGLILCWIIGEALCVLLILLPMLAVTVRRLHDTNHSGWWYFINIVPLIGPIWFLILMLTSSDDENRYGLPLY